ncbi:MAG: winged helix-turn-helix domain-containing protein [Myxococcota bacterium]|nr:winged helix-turn-helix domain-containing protein [Myxococcota bacterium]
MPSYQFAGFVVSRAQRRLSRAGREVPLVPRYLDLLLLLIENRDRAVHRHEILDTVWADVVVSDNALNQAVRTLRRALGDDSRAPRFIGTVSRYGYRFVHAGVAELADEAVPAEAPLPEAPDAAELERALEALLAPGGDPERDARRREAAETLHALGTAEALARLDRRPGHEAARALLRDARWDLEQAGPVPLWGQPSPLRTGAQLVRLRAERALRAAARRLAAAAAGGALAGVFAGLVGGLVLRFGPGSNAGDSVLVALPLVGLAIGGLGAAGVGAGLAAAEALFRSARAAALVLGGALGGGAIGALAHGVAAALLQGLFGRDASALAGGLEGTAIGAAAGLGYALATPRSEGGMATPRGAARVRAGLCTGLFCALATAGLAWQGSFLGATSLDLLAGHFESSQVALDPLARLLGEASPGARSRLVVSAWEGLVFGLGLAMGLTLRPRPSSKEADGSRPPRSEPEASEVR